MSRIDSPKKGLTVKTGTAVQLQGIAYAADRGISKVEVSTDGGNSWSVAEISYGKAMTWSLWNAVWVPDQSGPATLKGRATDGLGNPQTAVATGFAPAGSTRLHT